MIQERAQVRWANGLHLRQAAKLVTAAKPFQAKVTATAHGKTASLDSTMGLMKLGAMQGTELELRAEGEDAAAALQAVLAVLANTEE